METTIVVIGSVLTGFDLLTDALAVVIQEVFVLVSVAAVLYLTTFALIESPVYRKCGQNWRHVVKGTVLTLAGMVGAVVVVVSLTKTGIRFWSCVQFGEAAHNPYSS